MRTLLLNRSAITLAAIASASGCRDVADPLVPDPDGFVVDGVVEFLDIEGGCWAMRTGDITRYEPLDLAEEFRRDGLKIRAALKLRTDVGSYCMLGPRVEVIWVRGR
jgi:hypothetical protein